MATTATIPDCHTGPATAFFGAALQQMIISAAAEIITICMTMFMGRVLLYHSVVPFRKTLAFTSWSPETAKSSLI